MGLFAIELVLWLFGVRGHIPRFDDFGPTPATPAAGPGGIMRAVAAIVAIVAVLTLAVWLAIRVL